MSLESRMTPVWVQRLALGCVTSPMLSAQCQVASDRSFLGRGGGQVAMSRGAVRMVVVKFSDIRLSRRTLWKGPVDDE